MLLIGGEILAALRQKIHSRYRPNLRGHLSPAQKGENSFAFKVVC